MGPCWGEDVVPVEKGLGESNGIILPRRELELRPRCGDRDWGRYWTRCGKSGSDTEALTQSEVEVDAFAVVGVGLGLPEGDIRDGAESMVRGGICREGV
jgi:hypothetical protein